MPLGLYYNKVYSLVIIYLFIYLRVGRGRGRRREREKENLKQAPCPAWSPTQGSTSQPWDHDLS